MKIKKRFGKLGGYLPKSIEDDPLLIKIEEVNQSGSFTYGSVNNEVLKEDLTERKSTLQIAIGGYCVLLLTIVLMASSGKEQNYIFYSILFLLSSFLLLYYFTGPEKKVILDRTKGLFTYPNFMWGKPITVPFEDSLVAYAVKNSGVAPGPPSLVAMHPNGFTSTDLTSYKILETWYLYVWYMDKNRPLPPGSAFEPYRKKDFERRKTAGFPEPLYHSTIPTPEATPEQQAERKRIGGW